MKNISFKRSYFGNLNRIILNQTDIKIKMTITMIMITDENIIIMVVVMMVIMKLVTMIIKAVIKMKITKVIVMIIIIIMIIIIMAVKEIKWIIMERERFVP